MFARPKINQLLANFKKGPRFDILIDTNRFANPTKSAILPFYMCFLSLSDRTQNGIFSWYEK